MNLAGHLKITAEAIRRLRTDATAWAGSPLCAGLQEKKLSKEVRFRDVIDFFDLDQIRDCGQEHHFMRRLHGHQTIYDAYVEDLRWIEANTRRAIGMLANRIMQVYGGVLWRSGTSAALRNGRLGRDGPAMVFRGLRKVGGSWRQLADAIHALEDSFAPDHVARDNRRSPRTDKPGPITDINVFLKQNVVEHRRQDKLWWDNQSQGFSPDGEFAVQAVVDYLKMVINLALNAAREGQRARAEVSFACLWRTFVMNWVALAPPS
jgi:hypothetical protein